MISDVSNPSLACAKLLQTVHEHCHALQQTFLAHSNATPGELFYRVIDAKLTLTKTDISTQWPPLEDSGFLDTAHQRLVFETHKSSLDTLLRAFHDSCLAHPTFGPHLQQDPEQRVELFFKEKKAILNFASFGNNIYNLPWKPLDKLTNLIASLTAAPEFTNQTLLFLDQKQKYLLGKSKLKQEFFLDINPLVQHSHDTRFHTLRPAPITHLLWSGPNYLVDPISRSVEHLPPVAINDERHQNQIWTWAAREQKIIAVALPRSS